MTINILIPCAGKGSRFREKGFLDPKPFIKVNKERMIEVVIKNINGHDRSSYKFIFIVLKEFMDQYGVEFEKITEKHCYDYEIISIPTTTEGSACTALFAESLINDDQELIITDTDHIVKDPNHIMNGVNYFRQNKADGGFWNFWSDPDPKYSYVKINGGKVVYVAEKEPMSNAANVGEYYFANGKDFVSAAKEMINKQDKVRGEYYLACCYRYLLINGLNILPYFINQFCSFGTPQLLEEYTKNYSKN